MVFCSRVVFCTLHEHHLFIPMFSLSHALKSNKILFKQARDCYIPTGSKAKHLTNNEKKRNLPTDPNKTNFWENNNLQERYRKVLTVRKQDVIGSVIERTTVNEMIEELSNRWSYGCERSCIRVPIE